MEATVFVPIIFPGSLISTRESRAARVKSASADIPIPGASTPPRYSPFAEMASKLIAVPKSTTIHARLDEERLYAAVAPRHFGERAIERRHHRADDDTFDRGGVEPGKSEEVAGEDAVFVHSLIARRGQSPVRGEFRAAENAQHGVRVAHVQCEQHQDASATSPDVTTSMRPSSRSTRSSPFGSRPAVVP